MTSSDLHAWWAELRHHGLVVAPALLDEYFPQGPVQPGHFSYQKLRERYIAFDKWYQDSRAYEDGMSKVPLNIWLDGVLDSFLGHENARWQRANFVDERWKHKPLLGDAVIPRRILFRDSNHTAPSLFVYVEHSRQLMHGRGRAAYGKLLELLRAKQVRLGLLTNGRQFRLCYAGIDHDSWVEWDCENWFAEEELRHQLYGFYTLLGPEGMTPREPGTTSFPLLDATEASRTRQGELSTVLGEQVRQSVEMLLNDIQPIIHAHDKLDEHGQVQNALLAQVRVSPRGTVLTERRMLDALYQATVRIIMRMVIVLFAEARDMLPLSIGPYALSYSLDGLYEQLQRAEQHNGRSALEEQHSAWTRMLSLFTLIYNGSSSPNLMLRKYGGLLFRPGNFASPDAIQRAVALFELPVVAREISDATVLRLLKLLKIGRLKIRQGRKISTAHGPVDFGELRTEYIGLMYQGLLDFSLHATDEPMIFLNLGQEPILPLKTLEGMPDQRLKELLKKLSAEKGSSLVVSEEEMEEDEEDASFDAEVMDEQPTEEEEVPIEDEEESDASTDQNYLTREDLLKQRVLTWAKHAVEVAGLVKKPRSTQPHDLYLYEKELTRQAQGLFKNVLDEGQFYLTRRGGTRKGSGTFYTRPQLAVPIARQTLRPLLYTCQDDGTAIPKKPYELLNIKVCDPACGSAAFLVAALHYMTEVLFESLTYYQGFREIPKRGVHVDFRKTLPFGTPSEALLQENLIPVPMNDERFPAMTKAHLRRYIVENCIYGVDLSPLAVELARMSLWIETMHRDLPFTFLDHKIKIGNALVGGWFDSFREYPVMAWQREGGDGSHKNGVRYKAEEWTKAIKERRNEVIKPELIVQIESSRPQLFPEHIQQTPEGLFRTFTSELLRMHDLPIEAVEEREESYRALREDDSFRELMFAFDRWCAAWFWPADRLDEAPTPANFYSPSTRIREMVEAMAEEQHFFHWELEFLDVFNRPAHGFDALLANPPWETSKSYSKEFFSDYDLLYRLYGRQEALQEQHNMFERNATIEREWLLYQSRFKSMSNWARSAASPFGDPAIAGMERITLIRGGRGAELHASWRARRAQYENFADKAAPFRFQGSTDLNTYKMFLEVAHHLLQPHGRLGLLVPSGIYTDQGSAALRKLFLNNCRWEWLFGFFNRHRIFDIDSRFKFAALVIEKGGQTEQMSVAFNQQHLADLEHPDLCMFPFLRNYIERFSPQSRAVVELQTPRDITILEKLYHETVMLGDQDINSWQLQYATEFHMTIDSKLFPPLPDWEKKGYRPDGYGRWVDENGNVALPLYEGRMIGAYDPSKKGWVSGKARVAVWNDISFESKVFRPQYLVSVEDYLHQESVLRGNKISFMRVGSSTNARSMYAALAYDIACGHTVPVLQGESKDVLSTLSLLACLNSFVYDYALRCRLGGIDISYFIIAETPLIPRTRLLSTPCAQLAARLNLIMPCFAPQWLDMRKAYPHLGERHWRRLWAITRHERLRLRCILDAIIAELYGLEYADFAWILRPDQDNIKGFWRVDKDQPIELRHTTLALAAFKRLKEAGLEAFCQEDWQFSAEIARQLGPRFTDWQEQGSVEQSWEECEMHAQCMQETPIPLPETSTAVRNSSSQNGKLEKKGKKAKKSQEIQDQPAQLAMWDL
jgi:hypothetical protein